MNAIENIALIIIAASIIKLVVLAINPKKWMNFSKAIYSKPHRIRIVGTFLAALVLYYLIGAGITIVEIFAVMAFMACLLMIGFASFGSELIKKFKIINIWKDYGYYILIWVILLLWGLKELFF
ncbi:hypothetical protein HOD61_00985 [archaeon]|jgi:hypothetical protein|nr:hypothetical protein [archaeon]